MRKTKTGLIVITFASLVGLLLSFLTSKSSKIPAVRPEFNTASYKAGTEENPTATATLSNEDSPVAQANDLVSTQAIQNKASLLTFPAKQTNQLAPLASTQVDPVPAATNEAASPLVELVWIAPGTFMMGSSDDEAGRRLDEGPQTQVTLTSGFWLGKYELTMQQYQEIVPANLVKVARAQNAGLQKLPPETGDEDDLNRPVRMLSWEDANDFCERLTQQERLAERLPDGFVYRLPTEAEWEYACRAGTSSPFSFGKGVDRWALEPFVWYGGNSGGKTQPVGTKQPNAWGLYDMHGNIREWCLDFLGGYPGGSITNPVGALSGRPHVLRGGSWHDLNCADCRSASRHSLMSSPGIIEAGFRVALAPSLP
jgi:formylglycine-generating enzyme required for sulfatase activity